MWEKAALERTRVAFQLTAFEALRGLPAAVRCGGRAILGAGFFAAGLGASVSPGLAGLARAFLAPRGGSSSRDTPGMGLSSEKRFPEPAASSGD